MTTHFAFIFLGLYAFSFICALPLSSLDAATLLRNGQESRRLNTMFASLNATDSCLPGENACVNGSMANCVCGSWKLQACPTSEECFALPAIWRNGTFLSCTTEAIASSLILATGAQGGLVSNSSSTESTSSILASTTRSSVSASIGAVVVTETVTITPTATAPSVTILPPETFSLNPSEASSLLASLTAEGSFSIVTTIVAPVPSSPSATTASFPERSPLSISRAER